MRLIQDIRITYIHLHLLLPLLLLLRYSTNYHLESQDLKMIRQFSSMLEGNIFLHMFSILQKNFCQMISSSLFLEVFFSPLINSCSSFTWTIFLIFYL